MFVCALLPTTLRAVVLRDLMLHGNPDGVIDFLVLTALNADA